MEDIAPHLMNRRELLKSVALGTGALCLASMSGCATAKSVSAKVPSYLSDYEEVYALDPHQAAREWFRDARFGLFLHYGLYSLAGGEWKGKPVTVAGNPDRPVAEWIQFHGRIPLAEYAKLKDQFTAEKFDADFITDLVLAANMKYINVTTRHHDSFCLFRTRETDFNSVNSPARRDLVGELAAACHKKKIGLFLYYSHGRDWKHPHAPTPDWAANARPRYGQLQPEYIPYDQVNVGRYADFMERQIIELLTQYGPIAGIWLDGEGVLKSYGKKHPGGLAEAIQLLKVNELYATIRRLQPQCLVSYKQGVTGDEDFITPERQSFGLEKLGKQLEINTTLQKHSWGYRKADDGHHLTPDGVVALLKEAAQIRANLLVNTGPLPDGAIHPEDVKTLRTVGRDLKRDGFPN